MKTSSILISIHTPDGVDLADIRQALENVLEERLLARNAAWEITEGPCAPSGPLMPAPAGPSPNPPYPPWVVTCRGCDDADDDDGSIAGALLVGRD